MIQFKGQLCCTAEADAPILASGDPTALIFFLETGETKDGDSRTYGNDYLSGFCDALAFDNYSVPPALADL